MGRRYTNILETVGNTPVVKINKLAPPETNLFVKIEAFNPLGSVKDRLALGVIEDAERRGELKPGQTVIEATSGNTGIGLAMVCAQKGYPLVVTMAESFSIERRKLMRFLGAKVVLTPAAARGTGMVTKAVELAEEHGWFLTRQFENEANADMHSRTTAKEILEDFKGDRLDYWVTGFGTGGTLKGVARVLAKERPETKIVVAEPDDAAMLSSGIEQQPLVAGGLVLRRDWRAIGVIDGCLALDRVYEYGGRVFRDGDGVARRCRHRRLHRQKPGGDDRLAHDAARGGRGAQRGGDQQSGDSGAGRSGDEAGCRGRCC